MTFTFNRLIMGGNLVRDPEVKVLGSERTVASFTIAINQRIKTAEGEVRESVVFLDCEAWGRTAETIEQYVKKGQAICCEGRLKQETWTDKDGHNRSRLKMVVERFQFVGGERVGESSEGEAEEPAPAMSAASTPTASQAPRPIRPQPPRPSRATASVTSEDPPF